jgi:hypothetical protein
MPKLDQQQTRYDLVWEQPWARKLKQVGGVAIIAFHALASYMVCLLLESTHVGAIVMVRSNVLVLLLAVDPCCVLNR